MWWRKPEVKFVNGRLAGAVVRKSCFGDESYLIPAGIVNFTNHIRLACNYTDAELPPELFQVYCTDYYVGEVNNGGHSQFVGNSGKSLATNIEQALAGLQTMGARAQHKILMALKNWIAANPEQAASQRGYGEFRAPFLDDLDKQFFDLQKRSSIYDLSAHWIRRWRNLEIVGDESYGDRLKALAALNPSFEIRSIWSSAERNRFMLTDGLQGPIAVVCGAAQPEPDIKISVNAGRHADIGGEQQVQWGVTTDKGLRFAVVQDGGAVLFESAKDEKGFSIAGQQIAGVTADRVKQFASAVEATKAGVVIDLIMRRLGLQIGDVGNPALTAWKLDGGQATWIAHIDKRNLVVVTMPDRAALLDDAGYETLVLSKDEITAHHAKALRGRESVQATV